MEIQGIQITGYFKRRRKRRPAGGGAAAVTENITATWDGETNDLTPDFALDSLEFAVNDVVEERRSPSDPTVTTYTSAQATIIAVDPGTGAITLDSTFDFGGNWAAGTWYVQFWLIRAAAEIGKSNIETITLTSSMVDYIELEGGGYIELEAGSGYAQQEAA